MTPEMHLTYCTQFGLDIAIPYLGQAADQSSIARVSSNSIPKGHQAWLPQGPLSHELSRALPYLNLSGAFIRAAIYSSVTPFCLRGRLVMGLWNVRYYVNGQGSLKRALQ